MAVWLSDPTPGTELAEAEAAVARAIGMTDLGVRADPWFGEPAAPDSLMFRIDAPPSPHRVVTPPERP